MFLSYNFLILELYMNRFIKYTLIILLCNGLANVGFSQNVIQPKQYDYSLRGVLYQKEFSIEPMVQSNGLSLMMNFGEIKKYYLTRYYTIGFGILKHPKEYRQNANFQSSISIFKNSNAFVYGKQNSLYTVRGGFGEKRYLSEKAKRKGIAVGINYGGGVSLGLVKPYFLDLIRFEEDGTSDFLSSETLTEENEEIFTDITRIFGSSRWTKGFGQLNVVPGFYGKFGVHFSIGAFDKFVKAIEAGIMADVYTKKIPIMIGDDNSAYFVNLYLSLQFGRRK